MKTPDQYIARNIEKIKAEGKRDCFFGTSYIQRLCRIGYNQACRTIDQGLKDGTLERNPDCEWEYSIAT